MKKITLFMALIMSCTLLQVNAQVEIPQAEGLFVACTDFQDGDIYTDSGGSAADYPNGEETTMEFQAPAGETVSIEFTSFNVEAGWDSLTVTGAGPGFDGDYDGTALPPTMVSAPGGSLTFFLIPILQFLDRDGQQILELVHVHHHHHHHHIFSVLSVQKRCL